MRVTILTNFFGSYKVIKRGMHVTHLETFNNVNFLRRIL